MHIELADKKGHCRTKEARLQMCAGKDDLQSYFIDVKFGAYQIQETHTRNDFDSNAILHCALRSEEHTSELQSLRHLVCRLLLEKKKHTIIVLRLDLRNQEC